MKLKLISNVLMGKHIRILTIQFNTEISSKEIPFFRGAVLKALGDKANLLYHNHTGEQSFRYSYPLIQYKRIRGKAAMVCINEGADVINEFIATSDNHYQLGHRAVEMLIESVKFDEFDICLLDTMQPYRVNYWLPLNSQNYEEYMATDSIVMRIQELEDILTSNILSMLKSLDYFIDVQLVVSITNVSKPMFVRYKNIKMVSFDAEFNSNLALPYYIGLGKGVSVGHGIVSKFK